MVASSFCKLLGLWRGYDLAECTGAIHTPWEMLDVLGLVEIRWGDEQLMLFQPLCKWSFFMQWVIRKSLGLWRGYDLAERMGAIHTPWAMSDVLGLVEFRQGDEQLMLFQP